MPKMTMTMKLQIVDDTKMTNKTQISNGNASDLPSSIGPKSLGVVPTMTSGVDVCAASRVGKTYRHIQTLHPLSNAAKKKREQM